ncbi:peptidoglycan D,D-transpeptidase FtsI family protein [Oleiharenicola lentus]|uniref:peptidoglycan D,D-transpeptidase FtsI family protein n=1 Tax=Oleiharenicola lentus TaxID=2508720 RepID=UPI003F671117
MHLLSALVVACFAVVAVRLVFVQVIDRDVRIKDMERARQSITVEHARRGTILDRNGNLLATSKSEITIALDPWQLVEYLDQDTKRPVRRAFRAKQQQDARAVFAQILGMSQAEIDAAFEPKMKAIDIAKDTRDGVKDGFVRDRWVKIREGIDEDTLAKLQAIKIPNPKKKSGFEDVTLQGMTFDRIYRRVYPSNGLAAQIVGYLNKEGTPVTGAENHFDLYLQGQDGWIESEKDGARREMAQFRSREVEAHDGNDVVLTIDSVVQHIVEDELKTIAASFSPKFASIIVSDPKTGAILGMGSYPSYDLNNFNKATPESQRNYAVTDIVEPGSTFKIVAIGAALNDDLVTPDSVFNCADSTVEYNGRTIKLPKDDHEGHMLSVSEITAQSSNRGAAHLAMKLGDRRFYDYARAFGFGQRTEFALGGEVRGILDDPKRWDGLTISRMPMGHAVAATPLQIHMAFATIANGGARLRPQIIKEIREPNGKIIRSFGPEKVVQVIRPSTAATVAQLLTGVVTHGTGKDFDIEGFEVAAKTGTTQKIIDGRYSTTRHVGSFVGFFPASRPEVVISVIVDDGKVTKGNAYGRAVAAPSFKRIGEQLIQYMDIKPVKQAPFKFLAMKGDEQ